MRPPGLFATLISRSARRQRRQWREWEASGRPHPAPSGVKRAIVREYAERYGLPILVETGTFMGGTVDAMKHVCRRIYSIELDPALCARARARFARWPHISILEGDSGEILPALLTRISERCLFWLDGHYSGGPTARGQEDTPIRRELQAIFDHPVKDHVILIDDAREFGRDPAYPTIEALRALVARHDPSLTFEVELDVVRIHPASGAAEVLPRARGRQ